MSHSPAPWTAFGSFVIDAEGTMVGSCLINITEGPSSKHEANARVMAAAPDLLEVVRLFVAADNYDEIENAKTLALVAIAKAEV